MWRAMKNGRFFHPFKRPHSLVKSFSYAFQGIGTAIATERNLRIHLVVAALVLYFSTYYSLSKAEYCVLVLVMGLVVCCELVNTAIEITVDLEAPAFNPLAKGAKDVAAGAVLVSSIVSVAVAGILFWEPSVLRQIGRDILSRLFLWIPIVLAALAVIFLPGNRRKGAPDLDALKISPQEHRDEDL